MATVPANTLPGVTLFFFLAGDRLRPCFSHERLSGGPPILDGTVGVDVMLALTPDTASQRGEHRGHEERADDEGVEEDCDRQACSQLANDADLGDKEGQEHRDHDDRCGGDQSSCSL